LHVQYSYDDRSIVVVNSTYATASGLRPSVRVYNAGWNELYSAETEVDAIADSSQRIFTIPESIYSGVERLFFIDLTLKDATGTTVSHNFYWVPGTLTTFDWERTDYTHTPAARQEDLTALASLPSASVAAQAEIGNSPRGRELCVRLSNHSSTLAFQVRAAARTAAGDLIAPVFWTDNWIELIPGETITLRALLPENAPVDPAVQIEGWNIPPLTLKPTTAVAEK
jgi:exo-1,4-beta-D-glucosaminidase